VSAIQGRRRERLLALSHYLKERVSRNAVEGLGTKGLARWVDDLDAILKTHEPKAPEAPP
jgi:hypothetical protein